MAKFLLFLSTVFLGISSSFAARDTDTKVYIVNMGAPATKPSSTPYLVHLSMLRQLIKQRSAARSLLYSYKNAFNGFAAKLKLDELQNIRKMAGVVGVHASKLYKPQTTRSWDFMGFPSTVNRNLQVENDVIVGMIDTGAWPESESFRDDGMGPPPKKWKGVCQTAGNFTCNNKLIGARFYKSNPSLNDSARDNEGHGTHTASIVAGREVQDTNFFGLAQGTARGGVPSARIAIYKVCWEDGCDEHSVLAAIDDAIADGVDFISLSLGFDGKFSYDEDSIGIGAFHAMTRGILTSQAVGNFGPEHVSIASWAPWILSVAASTIDRQFVDKVQLGNGITLEGIGINTFEGGEMYPLIDGCDCRREDIDCCTLGCTNKIDMKGKIVFCDAEENLEQVFVRGGVGMITEIDSRKGDYSSIYPVPSSRLSLGMSDKLRNYLNSTKEPQAKIQKAITQNNIAVTQNNTAPTIASFSSRGPNAISHNILKPDISAPGVGILAAYSPVARVSKQEGDKRSTTYSIMSGTSMACPHATGAAAYVKSIHPDWTPAAIKSALMTTAFPVNGNPKIPRFVPDIFAYGAGHIDPMKAADPGLVYDAKEEDYIDFLCSEGYTGGRLEAITGHRMITCPETSPATKDHNYPSMTIALAPSEIEPGSSFAVNFTRTLTNVGSASSTYKATMPEVPPHLKIQIEPSTLQFNALGEQKTFVVIVAGTLNQEYSFDTAVIWSDGVHKVRSPLVLYSSHAYF